MFKIWSGKSKPLVSHWLQRRGVQTTRWVDRAIWLAQELFILLIIVKLSSFIFAFEGVPTTSMHPTHRLGDRFLVDMAIFKISPYPLQRGSIVVFRSAVVEKATYGKSKGATKRIVAVGRERVRIGNCLVYVNNQPLTENVFNHPSHPDVQRRCYYNRGDLLRSFDDEIVVPEEHYFVLGDNSLDSVDSRYREFGFVKHEDVIGRTVWRIWPPWRWGVP